MTVYYVSTSGSDSNNGLSSSKPFKTINKAINYVDPDDSIKVKAGTYHPFSIARVHGDPSRYINIIGYDGKVKINCGSGYSTKGIGTSGAKYWNIFNIDVARAHHPIYIAENTHHLNFHFCDMYDYYGPPSVTHGCHDIGFFDCKFHDIGTGSNNLFNVMGMPEPVHDVQFKHCQFYDTQVHNSLNFGHHDDLPHYKITVDGCHFYNNGSGDHIYTNHCHLNDCKFVRNRLESGHGGLRINAKNTYIGYNSVITQCGNAPLQLMCDDIKNKNENNTIEYNSVYNNSGKTTNYAGIETNNAFGCTFKSNYAKGQSSAYRIRKGSHTLIDPYNGNTLSVSAGTKIHIRDYSKNDFSVSGPNGIGSLNKTSAYYYIDINSSGDNTYKINNSRPPKIVINPQTPHPTSTPTPHPSVGSVECTCNVLATVTLKDHGTHMVPYTFTDLDLKVHMFQFRKDGYYSADIGCIVKAGQHHFINCNLIPISSTTYPISFISYPPNANISKV